MNKLISFLNINLLIDKNASENWKLIFYLCALAIIMISSAHSVDKKIHRMTSLRDEIKILKSKLIHQKLTRNQLEQETRIHQILTKTGLVASDKPPIMIELIK